MLSLPFRDVLEVASEHDPIRLDRIMLVSFCLVAFSSREPLPTSLEDAPAFVWSRFLDANRYPLRLKTLQINHSSSASSKAWPDNAAIASDLLPF
jgi:hypothetical protein